MCMKLKNNILLLAIAFSGLTGCNPAAKISVIEAATPELHGLTSLHGTATVGSTNTRDFIVESAAFVVWYRDRELGSARLLLPIAIPAGRQTYIRYDLAIEGMSLASMQTLQSRFFTHSDAFTIDVYGYVKWGGIRKKIDLHRVPLAGLMGIMPIFTP